MYRPSDTRYPNRSNVPPMEDNRIKQDTRYKDLFICDDCEHFTEDGYCTVLKYGCDFKEKD